jgi:hypothetical protein
MGTYVKNEIWSQENLQNVRCYTYIGKVSVQRLYSILTTGRTKTCRSSYGYGRSKVNHKATYYDYGECLASKDRIRQRRTKEDEEL